MTNRMRTAAVKQLPEKLTARQVRLFLSELKNCLAVDRPCIVLDCSKIQEMNATIMDLLLCCLEETLKRNGDAKLAAVPPELEAFLKHAGASRLFEIYGTVGEAVSSFRRLRTGSVSYSYATVGSHHISESVA